MIKELNFHWGTKSRAVPLGMSVPRMSVCSFTARDYDKETSVLPHAEPVPPLPRPSCLGSHCIIRTPVTSAHWEIQSSMEPELLTAGRSRCVCHISRLGPMCTCTLKTCCLLHFLLRVCVCLLVHHMHTDAPYRPEEGIRVSETGLSGCCEMPN